MFLSDLKIIYQNKDFVVVNKPSGLLVEGGIRGESDLEAVVSGVVGRQVWACHRLDRLTSGVVLMRKNARFTKEIASLFQSKRIRKEYWALVDGLWPKGVNRICTRIERLEGGKWANVASGGKEALSTVRVAGVDLHGEVSWVKLLLKTGRTHQARLHCAHSGCPVLGDTLYGGRPEGTLFGLHARSLRMELPGTDETMEWEAETPSVWREWLERLEG